MGETDPFMGFFSGAWAEVGGWGLFIGMCLFVVVGAVREWWVPGPRHRRTETLLEKSVETVQMLTTQNGQLITGNEITKHFFEETTPRRGAPVHNESDGGDSS